MFVLDYHKPYPRYWNHGEYCLKQIADLLTKKRDEDFDMGRWINPQKKCGCAIGLWVITLYPTGIHMRMDAMDVVYPIVKDGTDDVVTDMSNYLGITEQDFQQLFTTGNARDRSRLEQIEVMNWYINSRQLERIRDADNEAGRVGVEGSSVRAD